MEETIIYLVRHGETDWNELHRMQGRTDIPLNDRGRRQALCAGHVLSDVKLDAIYSSPLKRAFETASLIRGNRSMAIQKEPGLLEIDLGAWEGLTPLEIDEKFPGEYDLWRADPEHWKTKGSERFQDVQRRAAKAFQKITRENQGKRILIVSHMVCLSMILLSIAGKPINDIWNHPLLNGSLSEIHISDEGKASIISWGRHDYFPEDLIMKKPFGRNTKKQ